MNDISSLLNNSKSFIEKNLEYVLGDLGGTQDLKNVIVYALEGGGKRFRPFLVLEIAKMLGVERTQATQVATAIEIVHTYSLIHDDLPSMDNAMMRRGKPSCWRQFNEAQAILAGDAMIPLAFEILGFPQTHPKAEVRLKLIMELARAIGARGMVAGQLLDINQTCPMTLPQVQKLQLLKTGELIAFACTASAILSETDEKTLEILRDYGLNLGLLFQITDDFLDKASSTQTGKDSYNDEEKRTFVSILGEEGARDFLKGIVSQAQQQIIQLPFDTRVLQRIPSWVVDRHN